MTSTVPRHVGLCLALVQFFFALSWTVYVLYLPQLAAQAGLPKAAVPWLLVLDQAVFLVADYACGIASDRIADATRRFGPAVLAATAVSGAAFVLMPIVSHSRPTSAWRCASAIRGCRSHSPAWPWCWPRPASSGPRGCCCACARPPARRRPPRLRFASPEALASLAPVFWVGFNLGLWPASLATKRHGGFAVTGASALLAAGAALAAALAGSLPALVAAQALAGLAWSGLLMSAFA
ncbi:hypothetical protein ABXN37_20605 [Piscinibacter sakaiensis]|uniref:hypothetical protein n=1 Tax=Piscinibacter sakaiensis TaxID=1547922 RepID=UPI00372B01E1